MLFSEAGLQPVILDPATSTVRDLLSATDSFYHAEFKPFSPTNPVSAAPAFGEWVDGFIIANPSTYHIGLYGWNGTLQRVLSRTLPPSYPMAARLDRQVVQVRSLKIGGRARTEAEIQSFRERAAATPVPAFAFAAPVRTDAKARIGLSCPGFEGKWSLSGSWLAMVCAPRDARYDGDAVVRLFRITDPDRN